MPLECDVYADPYQWREPVARKKHRCCECHAPILPGEKYFYCWGKWDGDFFSARQHLTCMEACMIIRNDLNGGDCIPFGSLFDAWWELHTECDDKTKEPWKTLRGLMARIKWRERVARRERRAKNRG